MILAATPLGNSMSGFIVRIQNFETNRDRIDSRCFREQTLNDYTHCYRTLVSGRGWRALVVSTDGAGEFPLTISLPSLMFQRLVSPIFLSHIVRDFILEGIFFVLLSLSALLFLSRTPHHTNWLTPTDREILLARLEQDDEHRAFSMDVGENHFRNTVRDWKVWFYAAIAIMWGIPSNGIALALPTIVLRMGVGVEAVQWMSAVPGISE